MTGQDLVNVVMNGLLSGLPFVLANLGIYLIFRILDDFDLTVEGSYVTGAAASSAFVVGGGDPWVAVLLGAAAGGLAGFVTSILHIALKISVLLSGIIMSIALYSINLRILGKPNVSLLGNDTILTWSSSTWETIAFFAAIAAVTVAVFWLFMRTDIGLAIRGAGANFGMVRSLGVNPSLIWVVSLILCNALVGTSGAIQAQNFGFADVNMGIGTIVAGAASILLGEAIVGRNRGILLGILGVVLGTLLYRFSISLALRLGIESTDLRLFTAALLVAALVLSRARVKKARVSRRSRTTPPVPVGALAGKDTA